MDASWNAVPGRVAALVKEAAPIVRTLRNVIQHLPAQPGYGYVFWHPEDKIVHAVLGDNDDSKHNRWYNSLKAVQGVQQVVVADEYHPKNQSDWIMIKKANALGLSHNPFVKESLTSPNAMATTLAGGLLGGGLGYGAGSMLEWLFPERYVARGKLRRTLGLLGGAVGAAPGLWAGSARARMAGPGQEPLGWWKGFATHPNDLPYDPNIQGQMASQARGSSAIPWDKASAALDALAQADPRMVKAAEGLIDPAFNAGGYMRPIPLDAFGNAIWNDVRNYSGSQYNPYGTKSPWGDNTQPMGTPPAVAAMASGIVSGIGAQYGGPSLLSPAHFIKGLAAAGVDLATAKVTGGLLGALGGLTPPAQQKLQDMGLWGGMIRGIVGSVLGRY